MLAASDISIGYLGALVETPSWIPKAVSGVLFLGVPTSVLVTSWLQLFKLRPKPDFFSAPFALAALSSSYAFYLGTLLFPRILGPDYSDRRFVTIMVNLGLSVLILVIARWKKIPLWEWLTVSALVLGPLWFFVALINGAV
jgi:hypothetical protein